MAAYQSPKLLVKVRVLEGMPKICKLTEDWLIALKQQINAMKHK